MRLFPLAQPIDGRPLMKTVCHLYRISLIRVLPVSLIITVLYFFIRYARPFVPQQYAEFHLQAAAVAGILLIPLIGMLIWQIDRIGAELPASLGTALVESLKRFISLVGCYFSMLLYPALMFGLCFGVYIGLGMAKAPYIAAFIWIILSFPLIFSTIVFPIFGPVLVMTDQLVAGIATDTSERMVKGHYFRTFLHSFFAVALIVFIAALPSVVTDILSKFNRELMPIALQGITFVLLVLIMPWSFALLVTHKHDLALRLNKKSATQKPAAKPGFKPQQANKDQVNF